jgi:hypothetical protein
MLRTASLIPLIVAVGCFDEGGGVMEGGDTGGDTGGSTTSTSTAGTSDTTAATSSSSSQTTTADTSATNVDDTTSTTDTTNGATESASESGVAPYCGDGVLDAAEECDDGMDNGPGNACLAGCVANVCGDGDVHQGVEACDDAAANALEIGACAPNCSTIIEERIITGSSSIDNGAFGPNPVLFADSQCEVGYKAMFVAADIRKATTTPYESVGAIDWVLQPYTAYVRSNGNLVWITDETALLGVRDGQSEPLVNPMYDPCPMGQTCFFLPKVTGLDDDWTTSVDDTCNGWTNGTVNYTTAYGDWTHTTLYLNDDEFDCTMPSGIPGFYCVEQ